MSNMQSKEGSKGLGVGLMRRVGPQPPEPDWDRLDFRGLNGSRQAWGYLSPNDEVIVTNEGEVYVKIERENLVVQNGKEPIVKLPVSIKHVLKRTFRWVAIIKRMYVFEEEKQETPPPSPPSKDKRLHLTR
jgi:hypothetical protein